MPLFWTVISFLNDANLLKILSKIDEHSKQKPFYDLIVLSSNEQKKELLNAIDISVKVRRSTRLIFVCNDESNALAKSIIKGFYSVLNLNIFLCCCDSKLITMNKNQW